LTNLGTQVGTHADNRLSLTPQLQRFVPMTAWAKTDDSVPITYDYLPGFNLAEHACSPAELRRLQSGKDWSTPIVQVMDIPLVVNDASASEADILANASAHDVALDKQVKIEQRAYAIEWVFAAIALYALGWVVAWVKRGFLST
jgi:hypothetical protein